MTLASTCCATRGSPLCSQASLAGRCAMAGGPATTLAFGTSRPYRSSSARWQATARSAPATPNAVTRPSTYRPSAPRSAGTAVASTSTRGATTSPAPFSQCSDFHSLRSSLFQAPSALARPQRSRRAGACKSCACAGGTANDPALDVPSDPSVRPQRCRRAAVATGPAATNGEFSVAQPRIQPDPAGRSAPSRGGAVRPRQG